MIAIFADAFVKATVLLLLAGAGAWMLRRGPAALRHLVWALACGGLLALPVASAFLPTVRLAGWPRFDVPVAFDIHQVPSAPVTVAAPRSIAAQPVTPAPRDHVGGAPGATRVTANAAPVRFTISSDWTAWILPVWLSGVTIVLMLLGIGLARIWWLDRITPLVTDERWLQLARDVSRRLELRRPVRLLQAAGPAMPMTWGIRRPAILLPADAETWPVERRRDVLMHELAHVQRHDFLIQLIARVACAVYWFHPLVWLAATRLREERERACDDQVLRAGTKPSAYATHLLEIARGLRAAPATSLASVAMARPAQLATRLIDVLDTRRRRDSLTPLSALPAWVAAIVVVVPLAALAPRVAAPAGARVDTIPRLPTPPVPVRHGARAEAIAIRGAHAVADTLRGCSGKTEHSSTSSTEENENLMIFTSAGGCGIRLAATGTFTFTRDFTDIATVAPGAQVKIEVDYGAHDRRVTIQQGQGNVLERVYKIDGDVKPFDADAQAWLSETLTFLLRRTGFKAEERARWILETRGIQGLMNELGELSGDYARRIYFQAAVESGKLDAAGYERLVTLAGQTITSDYELSELLIAIAKAQPLTERMQAGFVAASKQIGSDYERHRVLSAALSRPGLTPALQAQILDAAADIHSDYELAELLLELNKARKIDEAERPAYIKAASTIGSDYEHRRVLDAVVSSEGMTRAMIADVLRSAQSIGSDYELAELLTKIGRSYDLDDTLRPPFFTAASSLRSDYEHARTLASVLERETVPRPVTLAILESAKSIGSDHELGELLVSVIRKVKLDDAIKAAIREDAQKIGSQYERGRVYEALGGKET